MKQPKQVKRVIKKKKKNILQRQLSPGGHSSKYFPRLTEFTLGIERVPELSLFFFLFFFISKRPESGACQCNNITNFSFFANYNNTFGKYNIATKIFYITLFLQDMKIYTSILFYTNGCYKVVGIISCYLFR